MDEEKKPFSADPDTELDKQNTQDQTGKQLFVSFWMGLTNDQKGVVLQRIREFSKKFSELKKDFFRPPDPIKPVDPVSPGPKNLHLSSEKENKTFRERVKDTMHFC